MNVVMVVSALSRKAAGLGPVVWSLGQELNRMAACHVELCSLRDRYVQKDCANAPVAYHVFPSLGPKALGFSRGLRSYLNSAHAEIVHSHGLWMYPNIVAGQIARRRGIAFVCSPHGMLHPKALSYSTWKKRIVGRLCENGNLESAACIHALSDSEHRAVRDYGLRNPVAIIPNGIYPPEASDVRLPPWEGRVPKNRKVIIFLGRVHPIKGLTNLIDAWARLPRKGSARDDWVLVIAGWSQVGYEDILKSKVRGAGIEKDVIFLGPVFGEAKVACLQNAGAFILPSLSEALPISILEAWSYGLPVIMTSECNVTEAFRVGAALEVAPTAESITARLQEFMALPAHARHEIGERGRALVMSKFTWPKIAGQMIEVYEWVVGQRGRPEYVRLD